MRIINSDILENIDQNKRTVIIHGCNTFLTMGAGIAKYISKKYPQVLDADKTTVYGSRNKLGSYSIAKITPNLHILNCYTQHHYRRFHHSVLADYDAIRSCLNKINIEYDGWEIRSPKIGCGLAGGNWNVVSKIFEQELFNQNVIIYFI